ncbi:MAG: transcription antitermination factor NusB [Roseburia sp.]|nr:transcription antitermination factor NusB [Roseburia sp.]
MKRRDARELAFRLTYEMVMTGEYNPETKDELTEGADKDSRDYIDSVVAGVAAHRDELKALIVKYAKGYEFDRIYKTDLAVMYLACYELLHTDTPQAVVVNEAVEIAKAYSDVQSYAFVNGILASVIKGENGENG